MARYDNSLLEAALLGYQAELARITTAIADIQKQLGHRNGKRAAAPFESVTPAKKKHRISAEGRARIAEAQRKRWAEARKGK
jgi:hypothetical protein